MPAARHCTGAVRNVDDLYPSSPSSALLTILYHTVFSHMELESDSEERDKLTNGDEDEVEDEPVYFGKRNSEGLPQGRGTLKWAKSGNRFEGRFIDGSNEAAFTSATVAPYRGTTETTNSRERRCTRTLMAAI